MATDLTTTTMATAEGAGAPSFRARLEPTAAHAGTVFISGDFDAYELDSIKDRAMIGVDTVRIDVAGMPRLDAEREVAVHLGALVKRGVKVYLSV